MAGVSMILEDIGITVTITKTPEYKEYERYYLNRNRLMRFLLRTFKWCEVARLVFAVRCALLNEVLERGQELFEE